MKFIIGKFSGGALHAVDRQQLSLLFKVLPKEWSSSVSKVVLSAKIQMSKRNKQIVSYDAAQNCLNIMSRGCETDEVIRDVVRQLMAVDQHKDIADMSNTELAVLDKQAAPYLKKFQRIR